MVRSWSLFGRSRDGRWLTVGPEFYVKLHGSDPVPVEVVEDPDGEYLGYIPTGEVVPTLILHSRIFEIQFPYGSHAEVKRGKGEVVSLSIFDV